MSNRRSNQSAEKTTKQRCKSNKSENWTCNPLFRELEIQQEKEPNEQTNELNEKPTYMQ